jgi:glycosyltransferase involved in cell wall biosynthesis
MLSITRKLRIVGTILAKNEEDIIGTNIEHHINQGVTHFIITNNNSTDKTRQIVEKYPEVVEVIDEPGTNHNQSAWVTRMAHVACKLDPDWIVHFDADELWCGLYNLEKMNGNYIGCTRMHLHPPVHNTWSLSNMRYYLDFDHISDLPGECKVAHRPDLEIGITHGNHGFAKHYNMIFTNQVWRHHYPIRNLDQFKRKSFDGHRALLQRGVICDRWKMWHDLHAENKLDALYESVCNSWMNMIKNPNKLDLINLIKFWSTPETIQYFTCNNFLPKIGEWPKNNYEK